MEIQKIIELWTDFVDSIDEADRANVDDAIVNFIKEYEITFYDEADEADFREHARENYY